MGRRRTGERHISKPVAAVEAPPGSPRPPGPELRDSDRPILGRRKPKGKVQRRKSATDFNARARPSRRRLNPVTSCVVEAADDVQPPAKADPARRLSKPAQTGLRALQKAIEEVGEPAPASNHIPSSVRVVTVERWRTYAYQSGISDTADPDAPRMAFKRAHEALIAGKHVVAWGDYRWQAT